MKFYKNTNKKFNPLGFLIGFSITVWILMQLTGCGQAGPESSGADAAMAGTYAAAEAASRENVAAPVEEVPAQGETSGPDGEAESPGGYFEGVSVEVSAPVVGAPSAGWTVGDSLSRETNGTAFYNQAIVGLIDQIIAKYKETSATEEIPEVPIPDTTVPETPAPEESSGGIAVTGIPSIVISEDTLIESNDYWLFGFRTDAWTGLGLDHKTVKPFELYYGLHASIDGCIVTYRAYSHLDDITPVRTVVKSIDTGKWSDVGIASYDEDQSFDLSKQDNGLFSVTVYFDNDALCSIPLYVNDGQAYAVYTVTGSEESVRAAMKKPDVIRALAEEHNVTPEKSLSVDSNDIAYPSYPGSQKYRCDTDLWREMAHTIVPDDTLSDSVKVIMLHDWMTENLAYDRYRMQVIKDSRAQYNNDYTGIWNVYNIHTGVCADFVNIFAIMCRELGVPCGSLDSTDLNHTWSIVYLDGEWWEIDLTNDIKRFTYKEDVTDVSGTITICYNNFLTMARTSNLDKVDRVNEVLRCATYRRTGEHTNCIHTN